MGESYFILSRKLEELGYNNKLPLEAVPLVECILADLLQTTRSLQHYMDLSKEALMQRDSLMLEAEPYKCDNAKLIQENNRLHKENMQFKEDNLKLNKESKRKIKSLTEELVKKETTISKLQYEIRDLSLRGLCAETQSSRNKSRRKETNSQVNKICLCNENRHLNSEKDLTELTRKLQSLEEKNEEHYDEIMVLKNQIEHRDNEIIRLNILLEGGRPFSAINKDCCNPNIDTRVQNLIKELHEIEIANEMLKKEVESALAKQHEAMLRALSLADRNKTLQEELQKVDILALKVEDDANKRLASMLSEINLLQTRIEGLTLKNTELEKEVATLKADTSPKMHTLQESLNNALKENDTLYKEIKDLVDLNKSLQDKMLLLPHNKSASFSSDLEQIKDKFPTKFELQTLLEDERKKYEKYIRDIQDKMTDIIKDFNKHLQKCKGKDSPITSKNIGTFYEATFVRDLHTKLCESEQKMLVLKKENDDYKNMLARKEENNKQNFKDVIKQLNIENSELTKENITLCQQLSQYKNLHLLKSSERGDYLQRDVQKLQNKIDEMAHELQLLKKDKCEYNMRYKEAMDLADKLKRDLVAKQNEIERLEEENNSYKRSNRTEKASTDHLKDECNFLRGQLENLQSDMVKEKTITNQIKNIQVATERSANDIQNELLCAQKKLSLSKDNIDSLERKCKESKTEILSLKNDKLNLIESIKKLDQERDKLVIELDNKVESISFLEHKLKSQTFEINKLENEITDLKMKLNVNTISEHKLKDYEAQISFLNGEILRLNQQFDTAIIENKHLQSSLADANGTLKVAKIEYEKSRKEVESLKQQLQHYVSEIRRIEEMLSQKEAERSDMLEQFASLSVEANILENTNHSLESESASKSVQLQTYISKIEILESKLMDKQNTIESQSSRIAAMTFKISALENEIKLITEEKIVLEQNISYLKQMCSSTQHEQDASIGDGDSELKLYENRIKSLSRAKENLELDKCKLKENLATTEKLLSNARKEIVELKLALQDATSETKFLQDSVNRLSQHDPEIHETTLTKEDFQLPLMLEDIHEVSHEVDDESLVCHGIHKRLSKYNSGTL